MKILIVEDDEDIREILKRYLLVEGFEIYEAKSIFEMREALAKDEYDVILLDIILPDGYATDEIPKIRAMHKGIGIIVVSARDTDMDRIFGIELGADDYVTKPFNPREVVARVKALLRRIRGNKEVLRFGKLEIYPDDYTVKYDGKVIDLSTKEFKILKLLASTPNKVFSREEILDRVWGEDEFISDRVVDVHVSMIRSKIGKDWIKTIRGAGYKFSINGGKND